MLSVLEIGAKIAVARKMQNLSQSQLAELMAVSAQAVGKWERGESMPDITTFGRLAEVLGVDLNYFADLKKTPDILEKTQSSLEAEAAVIRKPGWNMSHTNWTDADFSGISGLTAKFNGANIDKCKFVGSELAGLILKGNNINRSDFSRSDLSGCRFSGSNLVNDIFSGCDFSMSEIMSSSVKNCDFSEANLKNAVFKTNHLKKIQFSGAVLSGTVFKLSQLTDIIFDGEIEDCTFENNDFASVEFNGAIIRNTFFKNCKLKRAKFINCKADRLSYSFMASCKADLSGVEIIEK